MLHVFADRGGHAADQEIQPEKLHEPSVYDAVNGPSFLKRLAQCAEYPVLYAKGPEELLKIERVHPFDAHKSDRSRAEPPELCPEQRAAQNVAAAAFLHQELDGSYDLRAFLDLIKKYKGLPGD